MVPLLMLPLYRWAARVLHVSAFIVIAAPMVIGAHGKEFPEI